MRTRLLLLALAALVGLAGPAAALTAVSPAEIADELAGDPVFVEPGAQVPLDQDRVRDAVADSAVRVYVAVVTEETAQANGGETALVPAIGRLLNDRDAAVLVISDAQEFRAAEGGEANARGVDAATAIESALATGAGGAFDEEAVTDVVVDFVQRVDAQARGEGGASSPGTSSGGSSAAPLVLLGLGGAGVAAYALSRSRRRKREHATEMEDLRADVESLYGRLGSDVQTLAPGDDDVARQALADAAERYNATGALMAKADTAGEWAAARRTAVEGLTAARVVRQRLGLDPGPEIPMTRSDAPQLSARQVVQVGEEQHEGSPQYEPGRPHYFEGGYYGGQVVPGGWYATPFWQTLLLTSVLSGGRRGGYHGGGGYYGGGGGFSGGFGGGVFGGGGYRGGGGFRGGGGRRSGGWTGGRIGGGSWRGGGGGGRRGGGSW